MRAHDKYCIYLQLLNPLERCRVRDTMRHDREEKISAKRNLLRKALIPLPPTGFVSLFCANGEWVANAAPAQARCGVWGMFRNCTECKALQKSAVALHMCHGAAGDWSPRRGVQFTGTTVVKTGCRWCFRFRHRSYLRSTSCFRTLRKTDCEAQPIGVSSTLRHCTASPSISGCQSQSIAYGKNAEAVGGWLFFRRGVGKG